jgi:hypothetical protein
MPEAETPSAPKEVSTLGALMFFGSGHSEWKHLVPQHKESATPEEKQKEASRAKAAQEELKQVLLTSLQMQHVVVLAGSGTSLGPTTKGPSMWDLWDHAVNSNPGTGNEARTTTDKATAVITMVDYKPSKGKENIEELLSRCEAYLQVHPSETSVDDFLTASKKIILEKCTSFIDLNDAKQLAAHRTFLHRLSRRRVRDSRLKVFTTNYDRCFELAASKQGLVVVDGFSFTEPRHFDPRFFQYDIVRRPTTGDEVGTPLEGVFHLYKLHGSVNWERASDVDIEVRSGPDAKKACLIYPAKGKYQQSYVQPHLELISQYLSVLREPNTCLLVVGFGFNDNHLSEPILSAVRTNPHLRLVIVNPLADDLTARPKEPNRYWQELFEHAKQNGDVWFINSYFGDFAERIPDLKSLTPAERLSRDIKTLTRS